MSTNNSSQHQIDIVNLFCAHMGTWLLPMCADHIAPCCRHIQGTDVDQLNERHKHQRLTVGGHPAFVHIITCWCFCFMNQALAWWEGFLFSKCTEQASRVCRAWFSLTAIMAKSSVSSAKFTLPRLTVMSRLHQLCSNKTLHVNTAVSWTLEHCHCWSPLNWA